MRRRNHMNVKFVALASRTMMIWKNIHNQFMKRTFHTCAYFVILDFHVKIILKDILNPFIRIRNQTSAHIVIILVMKKSSLNAHVKSVHEKKRPNKCPICNKCFTERRKMKRQIKSFHFSVIYWHWAKKFISNCINKSCKIRFLPSDYDKGFSNVLEIDSLTLSLRLEFKT